MGGFKSQINYSIWIVNSVYCSVSLFGDAMYKIAEDWQGAASVRCLAWPAVQLVGNGIRRVLTGDRQAHTLE